MSEQIKVFILGMVIKGSSPEGRYNLPHTERIIKFDFNLL